MASWEFRGYAHKYFSPGSEAGIIKTGILASRWDRVTAPRLLWRQASDGDTGDLSPEPAGSLKVQPLACWSPPPRRTTIDEEVIMPSIAEHPLTSQGKGMDFNWKIDMVTSTER